MSFEAGSKGICIVARQGFLIEQVSVRKMLRSISICKVIIDYEVRDRVSVGKGETLRYVPNVTTNFYSKMCRNF